MGTGYSKQDTANDIANNKVIDADLFDAEFDALEDAFDSSTGHTHDGTAEEGGPISVTGPDQEYVSDGTALYPKTDDTYDLGKTGNEWKDLYVDGTANIDSLVADTADINGGTVDAATIGGTTPAAATVTDLVVNTSASLPSDSVDAITEIASGLKSGSDGTLVTGTAGTDGNLAEWNADGDLVDGPTPPSGDIVGTSDTQTLTNKTVDLTSNTVTGTFAEFNTAVSDATFVSTDSTATLTNKTIDLTDNTVTGTFAELNTAVSDATLVSTDGAETLTNKTIDAASNTISLTTDSVDAITEIASALKTGSDATLITGTAGTDGNTAQWNADGDLVDGPTPPSGTIVGTTDTQTLTNKTIDLTDNTLTGTTAEFNTALSDGSFATLAGTETLTNKTIGSVTFSGESDFSSGSILAPSPADKSAGYTAVAGDGGRMLRFTASATLTLTAAATLGSGWYVTVKADGGDVTIDGDGSETINGQTTWTVKDGTSVKLICNGTAFYTVFGSRGWEVIGEASPSAVATVDFTEALDGSALSVFRHLRITWQAAPATDNIFFGFRTSTDGGSNWDSGANDYSYTYVTRQIGSGGAASTVGALSVNVGNATSEQAGGCARFLNFNQSSLLLYESSVQLENPGGAIDNGIIGGRRQDSTARDAIQFLFSSGNIASGYIVLEGLR